VSMDFLLPLLNTFYHFTYISDRESEYSISLRGHIRILIDVAKFFQAYFDRIFIHKLSTFVNKPVTIVTPSQPLTNQRVS